MLGYSSPSGGFMAPGQVERLAVDLIGVEERVRPEVLSLSFSSSPHFLDVSGGIWEMPSAPLMPTSSLFHPDSCWICEAMTTGPICEHRSPISRSCPTDHREPRMPQRAQRHISSMRIRRVT
ncbi:predicted protein [Streptomyces iranensis]|uniref:Uncharacterized protein n=1 Tax=Streptomyces iranensis TaxID=576784 RepID=A0A060ZLA0_9ACTN|nr:predicted protein [Streptomyces iranensis]